MVFHPTRLYPHMIRLRQYAFPKMANEAARASAQVTTRAHPDPTDYLDRKPRQLRRSVSARPWPAIVREPRRSCSTSALNLDAELRFNMRSKSANCLITRTRDLCPHDSRGVPCRSDCRETAAPLERFVTRSIFTQASNRSLRITASRAEFRQCAEPPQEPRRLDPAGASVLSTVSGAWKGTSAANSRLRTFPISGQTTRQITARAIAIRAASWLYCLSNAAARKIHRFARRGVVVPDRQWQSEL